MAHLIRFNADPSDSYCPLWVDFPLFQYRSFRQRLWLAIRYVFGYQSKFGAYDVTYVSEVQASRIIDAVRTAYPNL